MPSYSFKNKKTNEITTEIMKMSEREDFLKNNPDLEQMLSIPKVSYRANSSQGVKVDDRFREVQQKAAANHPAHNMKMF